ncbi:phosphoglucomutase, chloroplastic [Phoenix dactylifera]|uniref:phosphoglucomutase (alpha-D-glucose-1,6-bisphosphate-dependent) n=1 Tax=Phoenix dactylifera TaxID=42345 RepID=A0A8B8ZSX1_PHODC|nr:phosphoglucomutase, chloroplastic [Phoenix dactylifera]
MAASTLGLESLLSPLNLSSFSTPPPIAAAPKTSLALRPSPLPRKPLSSPISWRRASPQFSVRSSSTPSTAEGLEIKSVPTKPVEGQKTGTSGLRKKVKVFQQENYLANWIQWHRRYLILFRRRTTKEACWCWEVMVATFNREAAQIIIKIAAGNGVGKNSSWQGCLMSTPAVSAVIRKRKISEIKIADIQDIDLSCLGVTNSGGFSVEVIDPVSDYLELMEYVFDFQLLKGLLSRPDFRFIFDAMHAVTGAYAKPIFVDRLGASPDCISNGVPLEDFGHGHPDPNLTYAKDLVNIMYAVNAPDLGAASDGDGDRNMILGRGFFITPSDSVAIIAANAQAAIPYFKNGPKGLARSMPTSGALDRVAAKLNLPFFEVPTGWKFFGNLMDAGKISICGEESFGTGSDHIREKDGIWAVLAWLSIIAYQNKDKKVGEKLISVADVAKEHWATYGRNFFSRYDYEECESNGANQMMEYLRDLISKAQFGEKYGTHASGAGNYTLQFADDFSYTDPVDGSVALKQGLRFVFTDGSRIIYRLSGTGSAGATIRIYIEQFEPDVSKHEMDAQIALNPLIVISLYYATKDLPTVDGVLDLALSISKLKEFTGREKPTSSASADRLHSNDQSLKVFNTAVATDTKGEDFRRNNLALRSLQ